MRLKIKHKLFSAMILANILVILGIYSLSIWSFNSSFRDYLDASRAKELSPLIEDLSQQYAENPSWNRYRDRDTRFWRELLDQYDHNLNPPRDNNQFDKRPPPPKHRPAFERRPPREGRRGPAQIVLADSNHQLIVGRIVNENVNWLEIKSNESVVGYLGYPRTTEITSQLDRIFIDKLKRNLGFSVGIIILVSALITLLLSRLLVKPLLRLRTAANEIAAGNYNARINVTGHDEIAELSVDFNRLAVSLEHNLTSRQQWIADISHELRTPVAILQGELEAIQDGVRLFSTESVDSLHQEIKRLSYLINDLHELSLSDSGALSYHFKPLNIVDIVSNVIENNKDRLEQASFRVKHLTPKTVIRIKGDENRLIQLFLNFLNNSLAYTNNGGLIEISYLIRSNSLILRWQDSAPGVSDQQLEKIFERLYRAESSRSRSSGGSGLGLSIAKNIIEAHDGKISAKHSSYGGVAIELTLPLMFT